MKIGVLSGSPKGEKSVTMQYVRFLEMAEPKHEFFVYHIGQTINRLENDRDVWDALIADIREADLILWATPVYFLLVPAQLKRFIELVSERGAGEVFKDRYAASITTSVHFFDNLAHDYLQGISEDLGMRWAGSFSAEMSDLMEERNQKQLIAFGDDILAACSEKRPVERRFLPVPQTKSQYQPGQKQDTVDTKGKRVIILHDADPGSTLSAMVTKTADSFQGPVTVAHLNEIGMKGGCLGCIRCAFDNQCIYTDGYIRFWEEYIQPADIIVYAGTIVDRYLSSQWKQFFDRSFFLGHIPKCTNKEFIVLVQGSLSALPGLREILTSLVCVSGAHLTAIITDEGKTSDDIDALINSAAKQAVNNIHTGYNPPPMFPAFAGRLLFRDLIWGELWPIFQADHRYFHSHGLYDFPQNHYKKRLENRILSLLLSIPKIRKQVRSSMQNQMVQGFSKVFVNNPIIRERTDN